MHLQQGARRGARQRPDEIVGCRLRVYNTKKRLGHKARGKNAPPSSLPTGRPSLAEPLHLAGGTEKATCIRTAVRNARCYGRIMATVGSNPGSDY